MRDTILEILEELRPDVDFEKETKLIDDKILESFDIVSLVYKCPSYGYSLLLTS